MKEGEEKEEEREKEGEREGRKGGGSLPENHLLPSSTGSEKIGRFEVCIMSGVVLIYNSGHELSLFTSLKFRQINYVIYTSDTRQNSSLEW